MRVVVEKIADVSGIGAITDGTWLPPDESGQRRMLFLGLDGAVVTDAFGKNPSSVVAPQFDAADPGRGFGSTYRVVKRADGSVLAISDPGLGGSNAMLWDPLSGRVLWIRGVQGPLVMAAPLRSARFGGIVTALAGHYAQELQWVDESGDLVATTKDKVVYLANSFGKYVVVDFDRDGNDELLFGTHFPSGSSQILALASPESGVIWSEKIIKDAYYLQDIRLGDRAASPGDPQWVIGVSTIERGLLWGLEDGYFRGTCQKREGKWGCEWSRTTKDEKWRESERARSIGLVISGSSDVGYVSGNSPEMSRCFYIRISEAGGEIERRVSMCLKWVPKRALLSRSVILPGAPDAACSSYAVIGFGESLYTLRLVIGESDTLP